MKHSVVSTQSATSSLILGRLQSRRQITPSSPWHVSHSSASMLLLLVLAYARYNPPLSRFQQLRRNKRDRSFIALLQHMRGRR